MASFSLEIAKSVAKDLRRIGRRDAPRLFEAVKSLAEDPFPEGGYRKLQGSQRCYRLRVGEYRILYEVNPDEGMVFVYRIRHRKDAYRQM